MNAITILILASLSFIFAPAHLLAVDGRQSHRAQWGDCTQAWLSFLDIGEGFPKYLSGDTMAAYGLFMFKMNRRNEVALVLEGNSYQARFWSIETYLGRTQIKTDHRFDRDIILDDDGKWRVLFSSHRANDMQSMLLANPRVLNRVYSIMIRIYLPNQQLRPEDLPRVRAINPRTGEPAACPTPHVPSMVDIPQPFFTLRDLQRQNRLEFDRQPPWFDRFGLGGNSAVPDYRQATQRMDRNDDVAVIRFKAPSFGSTPEADSRYWSLCIQNFARNTTLACLPDFLAKRDAYDYVTVVFARPNSSVAQHAAELGYNFIADTRDSTKGFRDLQRVVGFVYRNLLPSDHFLPYLYQGSYEPKGYMCSQNEFLQTRDAHAMPCQP